MLHLHLNPPIMPLILLRVSFFKWCIWLRMKLWSYHRTHGHQRCGRWGTKMLLLRNVTLTSFFCDCFVHSLEREETDEKYLLSPPRRTIGPLYQYWIGSGKIFGSLWFGIQWFWFHLVVLCFDRFKVVSARLNSWWRKVYTHDHRRRLRWRTERICVYFFGAGSYSNYRN